MGAPFRPGKPGGSPPGGVHDLGTFIVVPQRAWVLMSTSLVLNSLATAALGWSLVLHILSHR